MLKIGCTVKLQHLPLNAYVDAKRIWTPYLNESDFAEAQKHIDKFFELLCRLDKLQTVRSQRADTITKKFFEDVEEAFKQLRKAEKDEKLRRERDHFWLELKEKGVVKVEGGYPILYRLLQQTSSLCNRAGRNLPHRKNG